MADKKLRVFKLRNQPDDELLKGLDKLKEELSTLRISKVAGGTATKLGRIGVVRKAIAKYLTVINQKARKAVREEYKGKCRKPTDLRHKKTRAIRRRLSAAQKSKVTERQRKRAENFPLRKYALRD